MIEIRQTNDCTIKVPFKDLIQLTVSDVIKQYGSENEILALKTPNTIFSLPNDLLLSTTYMQLFDERNALPDSSYVLSLILLPSNQFNCIQCAVDFFIANFPYNGTRFITFNLPLYENSTCEKISQRIIKYVGFPLDSPIVTIGNTSVNSNLTCEDVFIRSLTEHIRITGKIQNENMLTSRVKWLKDLYTISSQWFEDDLTYFYDLSQSLVPNQQLDQTHHDSIFKIFIGLHKAFSFFSSNKIPTLEFGDEISEPILILYNLVDEIDEFYNNIPSTVSTMQKFSDSFQPHLIHFLEHFPPIHNHLQNLFDNTPPCHPDYPFLVKCLPSLITLFSEKSSLVSDGLQYITLASLENELNRPLPENSQLIFQTPVLIEGAPGLIYILNEFIVITISHIPAQVIMMQPIPLVQLFISSDQSFLTFYTEGICESDDERSEVTVEFTNTISREEFLSSYSKYLKTYYSERGGLYIVPVSCRSHSIPAVIGHSSVFQRETVFSIGGKEFNTSTMERKLLCSLICQYIKPSDIIAVPESGIDLRGATLGAIGDKLILYGGINVHSSVSGSLFTFEIGEYWKELPMKAGPAPRANHVMLDYGEKYIIYGGEGGDGGTLGDVWELDKESLKWTMLSPGQTVPSRKLCGACIVGNKMIIHGGEHVDPYKTVTLPTKKTRMSLPMNMKRRRNSQTSDSVKSAASSKMVLDDLWTFNLESKEWTKIETNLPPRKCHRLIPFGENVCVIGGVAEKKGLDNFAVDLNSWKVSLLRVGGLAVKGWCRFSAALLPNNNYMLFGGCIVSAKGTVVRQVYKLKYAGPEKEIKPSGKEIKVIHCGSRVIDLGDHCLNPERPNAQIEVQITQNLQMKMKEIIGKATFHNLDSQIPEDRPPEISLDLINALLS